MLSFSFWKVIIFGKEQPDEPLPPAMDALLRVYQQTIKDDNLDLGSNSTIVTRILTPSEQATSLIGEQGAMISSIMQASQTNIRVLGNFLTLISCISQLIFPLLFLLLMSVIVIEVHGDLQMIALI